MLGAAHNAGATTFQQWRVGLLEALAAALGGAGEFVSSS